MTSWCTVSFASNIKCIQILQDKCPRCIYKLNNKTNVDSKYIRDKILKFDDIINLTIYMLYC